MTGPLKERQPDPVPEIPGYKIEGLLGRGSTGMVYRAVQLAVDREVALKVLHRSLSKSRVVRRLQREARTTARLSHPNLVNAIDMGSRNGVWWYAMELVEGPSLAALLRERGRLGEREALRLFIPLCDALSYLAQQGVVHRDIKPGNILVDPAGRARLVDLGLAFAEDDPMLTGQGGTLGTPHYVSPEQARNAQSADTRSDIWSMGATLFHTVCGRPPFAGESVAEILSFVLYARIPDPGDLEPGLSKGLRLVLRKCLSRSPEARYQQPRELLADLERIRERRQVTVRRSALDPVEGQAARRARWMAATVGVCVVAVALLAWLRPWAEGGRDEDGAPVARYEELEELARVVEPAALTAALVELDELEFGVPPEFSERFVEVRATIHRRYNDEVRRLRADFATELSGFETRRDWAGAEQLVTTGIVERLEGRLEPSPAQLTDLEQRFELDHHRSRIERQVAASLANLEARLAEYYSKVVFPRVDAQLATNHWRSAWETLMVDISERVVQAALSIDGLPPQRLEVTLERVREERVLGRMRILEEQWKLFDGALEEEVERLAEDLEVNLAERRATSAGEELAKAFAAHLASIGLAPAEMLTEVSNLSAVTLERRQRKLAQLEGQYAQQDAGELFDERRDRLAPLWRLRDYARLEADWSTALELPYLEPRRGRIELELRAARELGTLLDDAAAGLAALAERGEPVVFVIGSIGVEGLLSVGPNPRRDGFTLRASNAAVSDTRLALVGTGADADVVVRAEEIERLAGFDKQTATPEQRLRRALFRWYEGDAETAAAAFPLEPLDDPGLEALAGDLRRRAASEVAALDQKLQEREAEAERRFRLINRTIDSAEAAHTGEAQLTIQRIDALLADYGDLEFVRSKESYLRSVKGVLARGPVSTPASRLNDAFRPTHLELDEIRREVTMDWDFTVPVDKVAWSRGNWVAAGSGLEPTSVRSRVELEDPNLWPRLVLRQPLNLGERLTVELEVEQPQESGPPQLLVVSVAGVHVAFRGGGSLAQEGRWGIASGGPEDLSGLVSDLLDDDDGNEFAGLVRGATHRIRVELTQGRGKADVFLDDKPLGGGHKARPSGEPGTAGIVVRSLEVVRLRSVRVSGSYSIR